MTLDTNLRSVVHRVPGNATSPAGEDLNDAAATLGTEVREGRADELDRPHQVGRDRGVDLAVVSGGSGSHRINRAKSWTFSAPERSTRRFDSERSLLSAPSAPDHGDVPTPAPKRTQTLVATLALVGATAAGGRGLVQGARLGCRLGRIGVSTGGIALLMLRSATVTPGAVLTVAGAACFALHISALSRWATPVNAIGLTTSSVGVAAALRAVVAFAEGGLEPPPTATTWWSVIYLALAATCCGFVVQAWAQSILTATTAAIVMTTEPLVEYC